MTNEYYNSESNDSHDSDDSYDFSSLTPFLEKLNSSIF